MHSLDVHSELGRHTCGDLALDRPAARSDGTYLLARSSPEMSCGRVRSARNAPSRSATEIPTDTWGLRDHPCRRRAAARSRVVGRAGLWVAVLAVLVLVVAACSSGSGSDGTNAKASNFGTGRFEGIPLLVHTDPVGARTDRGGEVTRSYKTTGFTTKQVVDDYRTLLLSRGWTADGVVKKIGPKAYRGAWIRKGHRLVITASGAGGLNPKTNQSAVQYNLMRS